MTNVNGYYFVTAQYVAEYEATDYLMAAREDNNGDSFFYVLSTADQHCHTAIIMNEDIERKNTYDTGRKESQN